MRACGMCCIGSMSKVFGKASKVLRRAIQADANQHKQVSASAAPHLTHCESGHRDLLRTLTDWPTSAEAPRRQPALAGGPGCGTLHRTRRHDGGSLRGIPSALNKA
jgi:hypothetical protein